MHFTLHLVTYLTVESRGEAEGTFGDAPKDVLRMMAACNVALEGRLKLHLGCTCGCTC